MTHLKGLGWILNHLNATFLGLLNSWKESVRPFWSCGFLRWLVQQRGWVHACSPVCLREEGISQTAKHWRKGPCPQEGTLRPQWWPGGSHLGPPIPQDSALIPLCFMASRVAFSAPGFPHAVSCAALLGTYVVTHHLALLQLPSGRGMKTWLFGSYKCLQPLWSFSWSECFSTSVDVIRKN